MKKQKENQFKIYMDECEKTYLKMALIICRNNAEALAKHLGVSRPTAFRLIAKHGLKADV